MKKRIIAAAGTLLLALALSACGSTTPASEASGADSAVSAAAGTSSASPAEEPEAVAASSASGAEELAVDPASGDYLGDSEGAAVNPGITRGMNYDVGILFGTASASSTHPTDARLTAELEIIRDDLHCQAVRVSGTDVDTMIRAAEHALQDEMDVWLSPHYIDKPQEEMREGVRLCAEKAQFLQEKYPDNEIVLLYGCEMVYFAEGFAEGATYAERMTDFFTHRLECCEKLNAYFAEEIPELRKLFSGRISYCSTVYEEINWDLFDIICLDHYRDSYNYGNYADLLDPFFELGKPVAVTEVGYCCYTGASGKGGAGYQIISGGGLNGIYERNESEQAETIVESLDALYTKNLEAVFVFTFKMEYYYHREDDPLRDLDMAGYGLVKCYADHMGETYENMPWDPKEAFYAVQQFYGAALSD